VSLFGHCLSTVIWARWAQFAPFGGLRGNAWKRPAVLRLWFEIDNFQLLVAIFFVVLSLGQVIVRILDLSSIEAGGETTCIDGIGTGALMLA